MASSLQRASRKSSFRFRLAVGIGSIFESSLMDRVSGKPLRSLSESERCFSSPGKAMRRIATMSGCKSPIRQSVWLPTISSRKLGKLPTILSRRATRATGGRFGHPLGTCSHSATTFLSDLPMSLSEQLRRANGKPMVNFSNASSKPERS